MRRLALVIVLAVATASPTWAQTATGRALRQYRSGMVDILEQTLFTLTNKTTQVIYAKRYSLGEHSLFCGEALFGSARQTFVVNTGEGLFIRPASAAQMAQAGCNADGGSVLVDLR